MNVENDSQEIEPIAIIGLSCRFPDADNTDDFWKNLEHGKESVAQFNNEELLASGIPKEFIDDPAYVKAGSSINNMEGFDYSFFGFSEKEAELIDPQQRKFIECVYESVEDAGYMIDALDIIVSVFGGIRNSTYIPVVSSLLSKTGTSASLEALLGNTVDQTCLRTSYCLGFKGPCIGVQTACSTSIVSIHLACESLRNGECDLAVAGASAITIPQKKGYFYEQGMILSPDGHCRAFDQDANGSVPGNGAGAVVLKRLSEALKDNDYIYALIKGSAVNNDGSEKSDYRIPSIKGLVDVMSEALEISDVDIESISYIEANGTGTFYGDSAEIDALSRVFKQKTDKKNYCVIGSVKANIGHLTQAAGIAAFIKTVLVLKNKKIPPSINCEKSNSALKNSPFYITREPIEWQSCNNKRIACVCSFAIGGSNAFVVLEEAPAESEREKNFLRALNIFNISAMDSDSLKRTALKYMEELNTDNYKDIEDICFTANTARKHYPLRFSAVTGSKPDLLARIKSFINPSDFLPCSSNRRSSLNNPKIIFFFSDLNNEFQENYHCLYNGYDKFKESIDFCHSILVTNNDLSLLPVISGKMDRGIKYSAAGLLSIQYSFALLLKSWGIVPFRVDGDGHGMLVADCITGNLNIEKVFDSNFFVEKKVLEKKELKNIFEDNPDIIFEIGSFSSVFQNLKNKYINNRCLFLRTFYDDNVIEKEMLGILSELYLSGMAINWNNFYKNCNYKKISLPLYPLKQTRCWYDG